VVTTVLVVPAPLASGRNGTGLLVDSSPRMGGILAVGIRY